MRTRTDYGNGTWLEAEECAYPSGAIRAGRKARAMCDGRLLTVSVGVPDTFFSVPAYHKSLGSGFVTIDGGVVTFNRSRRARLNVVWDTLRGPVKARILGRYEGGSETEYKIEVTATKNRAWPRGYVARTTGLHLWDRVTRPCKDTHYRYCGKGWRGQAIDRLD